MHRSWLSQASHRLTQTKADKFFRLKVSSAFVRGKKNGFDRGPTREGHGFYHFSAGGTGIAQTWQVLETKVY
jgi:hypothetical protein